MIISLVLAMFMNKIRYKHFLTNGTHSTFFQGYCTSIILRWNNYYFHCHDTISWHGPFWIWKPLPSAQGRFNHLDNRILSKIIDVLESYQGHSTSIFPCDLPDIYLLNGIREFICGQMLLFLHCLHYCLGSFFGLLLTKYHLWYLACIWHYLSGRVPKKLNGSGPMSFLWGYSN